ncbi:MAG: membrane-bound lytic murein transglycosylase MltF [Gammaproteobacteria bacterium]|nr:membrane-bound lytic murein transglycosylase MltF [Gammaproteobacteria bacterium]
MNRTNQLIACLLLPLLQILTACSEQNASNGASNSQKTVASYLETGDLNKLKSRGILRILVPLRSERRLPRSGNLLDAEQEMAANFARSLELEPVLIYVDQFEQLIPDLLAGKGDVIAANLTITESRKQQISFTVPINHSTEHLVTRKDEANIAKKSQLENRTIAVKAGTSYAETLANLQQKHPAIKIQTLADELNTDSILDQLVNKTIELTVLDSKLLAEAAAYRDDFNISLPLTRERPQAWGVRPDNSMLLETLNRFLNQEQLVRNQNVTYLDDLDGIKQRKTLRVLTRNNAASYFLWRGELLGFEYELVKAFAKKHKLRLEVIVAPDHQQLIPMLKAGKGDLIAAFMTITTERKEQGVSFSRPHHYISEIIVSRADDDSLNQPQDLAGRTVHVRPSSAYWNSLQQLKNTGIDFAIKAAPETMETEEIIARVATGEYDLTLADNHLLDIELTWRDDIKAAFALEDIRKNAWAVRPENKQLLAAINTFIKQEYKGLFYNITYQKYFKDSHTIKKHRDDRIDLNPDGTISPYDDMVKKYAKQYGFDWRMLVSQMYQESRFNPAAKSWAGAKGLMQVMPRTAKELGLTQLNDPETGIHAGVKYLNWVRDRFEDELHVKDRMWFALAAYNAGAGHVQDARRLARQQGWNPNHWFDNVEKAMLLLSKRKYAKHARHGYVRGTEPVNYVRKIRSRYQAYVRLVKNS